MWEKLLVDKLLMRLIFYLMYMYLLVHAYHCVNDSWLRWSLIPLNRKSFELKRSTVKHQCTKCKLFGKYQQWVPLSPAVVMHLQIVWKFLHNSQFKLRWDTSIIHSKTITLTSANCSQRGVIKNCTPARAPFGSFTHDCIRNAISITYGNGASTSAVCKNRQEVENDGEN